MISVLNTPSKIMIIIGMQQETLERDGYVYGLDDGIGFTGENLSPNLSSYTHQTCTAFYKSIIGQ